VALCPNRGIEAFLEQIKNEKEGKERLIAIHGNRVLLYLVFQALGSSVFEAQADPEPHTVSDIADKVLTEMTAEIQTNYATAYPANLFKNITKCTVIAKAIMSKLRRRLVMSETFGRVRM
jgi:hypothetical protein